jgi:ABC-type multidrug transport system ATPase subunit
VIEVRHVGKSFRRPASVRALLRGKLRGPPFTALVDVSFDVGRGEAFGLMGPNGAGKSTILRILAGLIAPTVGVARVSGIDAREGGTRLARKVGYVAADERGMQSSLSAREHLAWYAALYGFARAPALERVGTLLERVGLASHALRPLRELSTGMRRRVALARALIGDPEVIILDEPTRGVDPAGASALHGHLLTELEGGRTVVIATHDRVEARTLCARVAVLQASRLVTIERADDAATRLLGMQIG